MPHNSASRRSSTALRKFALALWLALWPLLTVLHVYPIRDTPLRYLITSGFFLLWAGAWGFLGSVAPCDGCAS